MPHALVVKTIIAFVEEEYSFYLTRFLQKLYIVFTGFTGILLTVP